LNAPFHAGIARKRSAIRSKKSSMTSSRSTD
jgi:hypothetical protein